MALSSLTEQEYTCIDDLKVQALVVTCTYTVYDKSFGVCTKR